MERLDILKQIIGEIELKAEPKSFMASWYSRVPKAMEQVINEAIAVVVSGDAYNTAEDLYAKNGLIDGDGDAFRHAYWSASLTEHFGKEAAKFITTQYEVRTGATGDSKTMDLENNRLGRELFAGMKFESREDIINAVKSGIENGKFIKLNTSPFMPTGK